MIFQLTGEHVRSGCRGSAVNCPYAICIREILGGKASVFVYHGHMIIDGVSLRNPWEVERDIDFYDMYGWEPQLREFELAV